MIKKIYPGLIKTKKELKEGGENKWEEKKDGKRKKD